MYREKWDLFDANEQPRGTFIRGKGWIPDGLYHKTVEVIPTDMQGHLLLTRRAMQKKTAAGQWEFTAGSVLAGESEEQAAIRELREETGLKCTRLYRLQKVRIPGVIRYTFLALVPNMTSCKVQYDPEEVMEYRFVDYDTWLAILPTPAYNSFRTRYYNEKLFSAMKELVNRHAPATPPEEPQSQEKSPLVPREKLTLKKHSAPERYIDENPNIPDLNWEPDIERGDDGA